ncbi:serine hydrolase-domain-containing protein [Aspergillus undulatus]|uniref:serine hydrolase-domain-containing protein n=1 Tax=Aspergillus undulatus TaxID=1810928 RepID=UPI003CCCBB6D
MPKILALHGHGTSAAIFKSQTAAFRSKLPESYTFDFLDAPFPSSPAPGIKAIYPDYPTYTWYREPTPTALREAHAWVLEYCRRHGPFDAVMGFSQGCSLLGSLALYHAYETRDRDGHGRYHGDGVVGNGNGEDLNVKTVEDLPFRSAIFICGGIPLYALSDLGLPISDRAESINKASGALLNTTAGSLTDLAANTSKITRGVGLWDNNLSSNALLHDSTSRPDRSDVFGLDFTSFPSWAKIRMPTVHVYGAKDPRWPAGIQLAEFCDLGKRVEFDHGGGHDIPRTSEVSNRITGLLREQVKNEVQQGDKGGKPGQWSARKAQMTASEYKARGGDYMTSKDEKKPEQKNLDRWGDEEWQTKEGSGTAKEDDGTRKRYLSKKAWEEMSEKEKEETETKKKAGSERGEQSVGNTGQAKRKRREVSRGQAEKKSDAKKGDKKGDEGKEDEVEWGEEEEEDDDEDGEEEQEGEGEEDEENEQEDEEAKDEEGEDGKEDGVDEQEGSSEDKKPEKKRQKKN